MNRAWLRPAYGIAFVCGLSFVLLTGAFSRGWTDPIDRAVLNGLRGNSKVLSADAPLWLIEIMRDITSLAGVGLVILIGLMVLIYLGLRRKWRAMIVAIVLMAGNQISVSLIKSFISRPRPDLVEHGAVVATHSFPSGHSATAAAIALLLAWTGARLHEVRSIRAFCWVLGVGAALLIGFSRMYLGVHWFSDVVAGLMLGSCWAFLCIGLGESLQCCGQPIDRALARPVETGTTTDRLSPANPQSAASA